MNVHEGHRERLKRQFAEHGLDTFEDHAVLELLLFYALPRMDVNELAHALIDHFGSLDAVLDAPIDELLKLKGVGLNTAMLLHLVPQVGRRYGIVKTRDEQILNSTDLAGAYLIPFFVHERDEVAYAVFLDTKLKVLCPQPKVISRGAAAATDISIRKIVEWALSLNASGVILAHNHISGVAIPSKADETSTKLIKNALTPIGIRLIDHIVVAGDDFVSMSDSGML